MHDWLHHGHVPRISASGRRRWMQKRPLECFEWKTIDFLFVRSSMAPIMICSVIRGHFLSSNASVCCFCVLSRTARRRCRALRACFLFAARCIRCMLHMLHVHGVHRQNIGDAHAIFHRRLPSMHAHFVILFGRGFPLQWHFLLFYSSHRRWVMLVFNFLFVQLFLPYMRTFDTFIQHCKQSTRVYCHCTVCAVMIRLPYHAHSRCMCYNIMA